MQLFFFKKTEMALYYLYVRHIFLLLILSFFIVFPSVSIITWTMLLPDSSSFETLIDCYSYPGYQRFLSRALAQQSSGEAGRSAGVRKWDTNFRRVRAPKKLEKPLTPRVLVSKDFVTLKMIVNLKEKNVFPSNIFRIVLCLLSCYYREGVTKVEFEPNNVNFFLNFISMFFIFSAE